MAEAIRTIDEINAKVRDGSVHVLTADEMTKLVAELGPEEAAKEVDVVTTGTFGAMCSSGLLVNFGHADPPIKMTSVKLNQVEAYAGITAVDAYLGATQPSTELGIDYGGGHVIEDLLDGKSVHLEAESYGTDCYPRKKIETDFKLNDLNQAILFNPRNGYERYNVATNSSGKTLHTYMGKLLPNYRNATYSGAGELSPLINDSKFRTIGIGTRILLGGGEGYVVGNGTQHSPSSGFSTLMLEGNLKNMSSNFIKGASFTGYGSTIYIGFSIPIPVLDSEIAKNTGISDREITTNIFDYSLTKRNKPVIRKINYEELKSGEVEINGSETKTSPISSFSGAKKIAVLLQEHIKRGIFTLTQAVQPLPRDLIVKPLRKVIEPQKQIHVRTNKCNNGDYFVSLNRTLCIDCGLCLSYCDSDVFYKNSNWEIFAEPENCTECLQCKDVCPQKAINLKIGGGEIGEI